MANQKVVIIRWAQWVFLGVMILFAQISHAEYSQSTFQDGDIVFQVLPSSQSKAIQLATHSKYSHVGIVFVVNGRPVVYEAVQPVRVTPLDRWVAQGGGHFVAKRLEDESLITPQVAAKMRQVGSRFIGKNYDAYFEWSDERIYCSELVWKIYQEALGIEVGERKPLASYDLSHPQVQAKMKERYGNNPPLGELMISPGAMFESGQLKTVYSQ